MPRALRTLIFIMLFSAAPAATMCDQAIPYERPVTTAPQEESIGGNYKTPEVQKPLPRGWWLAVLDVVLMGAAMGASVWIVTRRRKRSWLVGLTIASLAYFGFYRQGCICPIGSIQNVVVALTDPKYSIPIVAILVFFMPLVIALFFGRVFCGGVCPLGAMQELAMIKPLRVPKRLDQILGFLKYAYLALAIIFAIKPALTRDFLICRFDPFVGFFRFTGVPYMLAIGGAFLIGGMFIGRPYCRYLCPYGGLLAWCSKLSKKGVTITPDKELDCGLCTEACPFGAIEQMRAVRSKCLYCARCYASCPRDGELAHAKKERAEIGGTQ
jgi:NosR/NirI family transcriptional regulator, nitrous oxide reductase regulator